MLRPFAIVACALALVSAAAPTVAFAQRADGSPTGTWRNEKDSVRIRVASCPGGRGLCGTVVQASAEARDKAAAGGTDRLVGTQLFRGLEREDDGLWYGEVFVPDIGQTVEGSLELAAPNRLLASGCLFAGFGCKTQTWVRVAGAASAPAKRR